MLRRVIFLAGDSLWILLFLSDSNLLRESLPLHFKVIVLQFIILSFSPWISFSLSILPELKLQEHPKGRDFCLLCLMLYCQCLDLCLVYIVGA